MALLARLVRAAEARPFHPLLLLIAATWVTGVRYLEEKAFVYDVRPLPLNDHGALVAWLCFYFALGLGIAAILTHLARVPWQRAQQAAAFGMTLAILPPLVDVLVHGRGNFSYRYQDSFFTDTTFLLFNHDKGLPLGEGLVVWGSIVLVGLYTHHKTRTWWRALAASSLMYAFSLLYGVLIPGAALGLQRLPTFRVLVDQSMIAWLALATALVAHLTQRPALVVEGARRLPQIALGPALVLLGAAWSGRVDVHTAVAALAFAGASLVFALSNKHYDRREDQAGGLSTGVTHDDAVALYAWALLVALSLWKTHLFVALCVVLFLVATYAYQGDPLRVKCVFPLSYKGEGFFAASAFVAGLLAAPGARLDGGDALAIFLIFGGFFLSAPFKDAKDVDGDRAAGVHTLYVVLQRRGVSFAVAHAIAGVLLATCLSVPVVYLARQTMTGPWLGLSIALAVIAVLATRLPWRRLGVGVSVSAIALYCAALAMGLLSRGE